MDGRHMNASDSPEGKLKKARGALQESEDYHSSMFQDRMGKISASA